MKNSAFHKKDFYFISEVASLLHVSTHTIRNLENEFSIEVKKDLNGKRVYTITDIEKYRTILEKKNEYTDVSTVKSSSKLKHNKQNTDNIDEILKSDPSSYPVASELPVASFSINDSIFNSIKSVFTSKALSFYSIALFTVVTAFSFGSFYLDKYLDLNTKLSDNRKAMSNVLQSTNGTWDYRFDVNIPAYFNNSLYASNASMDLIKVGDRVVITPTGITAPNIVNSVNIAAGEKNIVVDNADVNNPVLSLNKNLALGTVTINSLKGVKTLDPVTVTTIQNAVGAGGTTDAQTLNGLADIDFLRSNADTVFSNGIMTFETSSTLKFNNLNPNTLLRVNADKQLVSYSINPGLNVSFDSTATSLTINVATGATSNVFSSVAIDSLFLGGTSFDFANYLLSSAAELNKLHTLAGSLITTGNIFSIYPNLDTNATNNITTSNIAASILTAFPSIDTNATNKVLVSSLASLMLSNYPSLDTNAGDDITSFNLASSIYSLFPNIDTNALDDMNNAVLIDSSAGKSVYSTNTWYGTQTFNTAIASNLEIVTNGKITLNAGAVPGVTTGSIYNTSGRLYFEDLPLAQISSTNISSNVNKLTYFVTDASGKLLLEGTNNIALNLIEAGSNNQILGMNGSNLKYLTVTGDLSVTTTSSSTISFILNNVNSTTGTFGNNSYVPQIAVNSKGLVTSITTVAIAIQPTNPNNYVSGISYSTPANGTRDFVLSRAGLSNLTASFTINSSDVAAALGYTAFNSSNFNAANITNALGFVPQTNLGYTPLNSSAFNATNITNALGYIPLQISNIIAGTNITIDTTATTMTINGVVAGTNANNYVNAISFSTPNAGARSLILSRMGLANLIANFSLSSSDITSVLGYTPMQSSDDKYITSLGIETNLIDENVQLNFSLGRSDTTTIFASTTLTPSIVSTALGYIPLRFSDISATNITNALGFIPFNSANFNSGNITNALGFVPVNSSDTFADNAVNTMYSAYYTLWDAGLGAYKGYIDYAFWKGGDFKFGDSLQIDPIANYASFIYQPIDSAFHLDFYNGGNLLFSSTLPFGNTQVIQALGYTPFDSSSFTGINIANALGYTPLRNTSDTLSGNLVVTGNISQNGYGVCDASGNCAGLGGTILGNGTAGYLSYFTNTNSIANSIIYQTSSRIGILTTNPQEALDVNGAIKLSADMGTLARSNTLYNDGGVLYWNGQVVGVTGSTGPGGINGTQGYLPYFNTSTSLIATEFRYDMSGNERALELITPTTLPTYIAIGHKNDYSAKFGVAADSSAYFTRYDSEDDVILQNVSTLATSDMIFALDNTDGKFLFGFGTGTQKGAVAINYQNSNDSAYLGVNNTNPSYALDVNGSARVTGTIASSTFSNPFAGSFNYLSGANFRGNLSAGNATLNNLSLANALPVIFGGTGLTDLPTNGQLLIGNGTGYSLATLTAGSNVSISTTAGGITISSSYIDTTNANNYVSGISFSNPATGTRTLVLSRAGLSNLTATFSLSSSDINTALGYTPLNATDTAADRFVNSFGIATNFVNQNVQFNFSLGRNDSTTILASTYLTPSVVTTALGYTPLNSTAFNSANITNAIGYVPFNSSSFTGVNIINALGYTPLSSTDTFADNAVDTLYSNYYTMYDVDTNSTKGFIDYAFYKGASFKFGNTLKIDPIVQSMYSYYDSGTKNFYYDYSNGETVIFEGTTYFGTSEVIGALGYTPFDNANFNAGNITNALGYVPQANLGYTPLNSTAFNAANITTALGYTPFNSASFTALNITNALGYVPQVNLGYTPLNSSAFNAANITTALGYTPLKNTTDTLTGNLGVSGTFSAAYASISQDLTANHLYVTGYANSAYSLQFEPSVGTANRVLRFDVTATGLTNATIGINLQSVNFTSPSNAGTKNLTFNQASASSSVTLDIFKSGTLPAIYNNKLDTFGSDLSAATGYFTNLSLANALPVIFGGTGLTALPTNGQLLIGNGTGYTLATLVAGANVSITNASGSITINSTDTNYYPTSIAFTDSASAQKTLTLNRNGQSAITAIFSLSSSDINTALGYTPLKNSTDYMTGNLGVNGNFSAANGNFTNIFATTYSGASISLTGNLSAATGNFTGNLSASTAYVNGYFSAGASSLGATTINGNLSAALASFTTMGTGYFSTPLANKTFNFMSGTIANGVFSTPLASNYYTFLNGTIASNNIYVNGYFSAGSSSLGATTINGNLSAALASFTTMGTGYFSTPLANNTFNFMSGTIANGVFSTPLSTNLYTFLGGTIASNNIYVNGYFSAGASSLGATTINGNLSAAFGFFSTVATSTFSNPLGGVFTFLSGANFSGNISAANGTFVTLSAQSLNVNNLFTVDSFGSVFNNGVTFNDTVEFNAVGDLAVANDLVFTNNSFSKIRTATDLSIEVGEPFNSSNLNLTTYNNGVINLTGNSINISGNLSGAFASFTTLSNGYFSTPLSTNLYTFLGGTIASNNIYVNGYFSAGSSSLGATTINGNLSAALASFTGLGVSGNLSAATGNFTGNLSAATGNFTGNLSASTAYINGYFSAGSSSLGATTINGNLSAALASFTTMGTGYFSTPLANKTFNFMSGTIANGVFSTPLASNYYTFLNGTIASNNIYVNGYFSAGASSLGATTINGNLSGTGDVQLAANSNITVSYISSPNAQAPRIRVGNTGFLISTGAGAAISDARLKEGITNYEGGLSIIDQLNPVSFNLKNTQNLNETLPGRNFGFIAQDMENVLPQVVVNDVIDIEGTFYKGIDYGRLTPVLVSAIKEQQVQILALSSAQASVNFSQASSMYEALINTIDNLSMSTENGSLVVNTNLTVTGRSLFNDASFTGDVTIGQMKFDSLNNDLSINGSSCVNIDGTLNNSLCNTQAMYIMKNKAGNLNIFDGKVVISPDGEMTVEKIHAGEVAAAKVKASEYEVIAGSEVSGNSNLLTGQTEITILTSKVRSNSKIFVTSNSDLEGKSIYVSNKVEGVSFTVKLNQAISKDVNFDWFILNIE